MRHTTKIVLVSIFALLSACSMSKDTSLAEAKIPSFHALLNAGDFDELYEKAAKELKNAATKQDFVKLLSVVHGKLGQVTKSENQTWQVNYNTSGSFVTLVYNTTFTNGSGTEQFVYKISNGQALLVGYHINSNALITS